MLKMNADALHDENHSLSLVAMDTKNANYVCSQQGSVTGTLWCLVADSPNMTAMYSNMLLACNFLTGN